MNETYVRYALAACVVLYGASQGLDANLIMGIVGGLLVPTTHAVKTVEVLIDGVIPNPPKR